MNLVLLIIAAIFFVLATFGVDIPIISEGWAGLLCWVIAEMIGPIRARVVTN